MFMFVFVCQGTAQITGNVFLRVRMIRPIGSNTFGTGFTLEVDGRQYLITAKHVVASLKEEDTIQLNKGNQWDSVKVRVFRCDDPIDIAILIPPKQLTRAFPLEATIGSLTYAQDMYFAGFPYGIFTHMTTSPLPFVKKAIWSAISTDKNGVSRLFLDGYNNPGFSGGPIVYEDIYQRDVVFKLAGVIAGFRFDRTPVQKPEEITREQIIPKDLVEQRIIEKNGRLFRLNDTDDLVNFNTGIVIGYNVSHALDLIRKHPLGPKVSDTFKE
jgi:Trypsin-like peptidase domain